MNTMFYRCLLANQFKLTLVNNPMISEDDMVVVLMGASGTGKTTFVQSLTGIDLGVGYQDAGSTPKIRIAACPHPDRSGRSLFLIDTPGLDNTTMSDADILETIAFWLAASYDKNITLSGILFFHRITDNRIAGISLRSLQMFQNLCGEEFLKNVVLVSTRWDEVDSATGEQREADLRNNPEFWHPMLQRKSRTARFTNTPESSLEIIMLLQGIQPSVTQIQRELVDQGLPLARTTAGAAVDANLSRLGQERQKILYDLEEEAWKARLSADFETLGQIEEDRQRSLSQLEQIDQRMKRLRKTGLWHETPTILQVEHGRPHQAMAIPTISPWASDESLERPTPHSELCYSDEEDSGDDDLSSLPSIMTVEQESSYGIRQYGAGIQMTQPAMDYVAGRIPGRPKTPVLKKYFLESMSSVSLQI